MRSISLVGVAVAFLMFTPDARASDRTLSVDPAGTELKLVSARYEGSRSRPALTLIAEPVQSLNDKAAQAAAEQLFERYMLGTARRQGVTRAAIIVRSPQPQPKDETKRMFRFADDGGGDWSIENHAPTSTKKPYLDPKHVKLHDGRIVKVERVEHLFEHGEAGRTTLVRAELLIEGKNPMMERGDIYLDLADYWRDVVRPMAAAVDAAEIVASFVPRERRYQARDGLELRLDRGDDGAWPDLPAMDTGLPPLALAAPVGGAPQARFGTADATRLDLILAEILEDGGAATPPAGLTAATKTKR